MEVAAFWICVAAVIIMVGWFKSRGDAERHQTFRTIVEKTGAVDEAQLRMLFNPPSVWNRSIPFDEAPRGGVFRALRVMGTVVMFGAVGFMIYSGMSISVPEGPVAPPPGDPILGIAASTFVFLLGAGLFFASRFVEKPSERPPPGPANE